LTINQSNTHLLGEGGQNSKIFFKEYGAISETYGHGVVYAEGKENIRVEGLYVCGAGGPRSWDSDFGIGLKGCNDSAIVNNIVENLAGAAMGISGTDPGHPAVNGLIEGNIVRNCHSDGISGQLNDGIRVIKNYVTNNGEDGNNYPILFEWTYGSLIHGNVCDTSHNGIILNNTGDARASTGPPSIISNNTVRNSEAYGIFLAGAYHTVVEGNTIWKASGGGIFIHEPNWKHQGQGNLVTGNMCYGSGTGGIGCTQNNNTIKGNILVNNNMLNNQSDPLQASGVVLTGSASYNLVEGNYIYNTQDEEGTETGCQKYGVIIASPAETGNRVINNATHHLIAEGQAVLDRGTDTVVIDSPAGSGSQQK
jgi:parallel beta-helix repeat protein